MLGKILGFFTKMFFTEKVIKKVLVELGDYLVKSTKNELDDKIWNDVKSALEK